MVIGGRRRHRSAPGGVNAITFLPGSGYGEAGALYVKGLDRLGVPVTWNPLVPGSRTWGRRYGIAPLGGRELDAKAAEFCDAELLALCNRPVPADVLLVQLPHEWWMACLERSRCARSVVYTTWETDRLPAGWAEKLNRFDLVIVPSHFNRRAFLDSGVRVPIEVVPHGARPVEPVPGGRLGPVEPDDFVFYTIAEWGTRKAVYETVRAYLDAFSADEKVVLVVKTSARDHEARAAVDKRLVEDPPPYYANTWWTLSHILAEYARPARVHLMPGGVPARTIDQIHTRGDCFVSLTRGEGWGLGAFDAALFDNPSIITGWSAHLEYLGDDHPLLVDFELEAATQRTPDGRVFERDENQRWAAPDRAHASELMRWAFEHPARIRELGAELGHRIRRRYEQTRVCRHLAGCLGFDV